MNAASTPEPYVGTRPFDQKDSENFFGRDREADDLFSLVLAVPVVLIYAASGAGKSSLLNAGLIPRLEKEGFQILGPAEVTGPVPPATRKITNIYRFHTLSGLNKAFPIATESELASLSLSDFLQRLYKREPGRPRVLIFDQFEKFFIVNVAQSEQRRAFIDELAEVSRAGFRLKVVFAMREEYIAQFEVFAYSLPDKLRTRMRLEPLRERAAVEAIRGPLERIGLFFEKGEKDSDNPAEGLVRELLKIHIDAGANKRNEIAGEFVEPIQLQVVCQNMWRNFPDELKACAAEPRGLQREKKIIARDQIKIGDVTQALAEHYDRAIEDASRASGTSRRQLRRWFGYNLITGAGMRGIALATSDETAQLPQSALEVFLAQRLVRKESRGGSEWYELTHDRFIEPIQRSNRAWFEQRAVSEALLLKLEAKAGTVGVFLDESETRDAEAFLASPDGRVIGLSPRVESLVRASRLRIEKDARQRRIKLTLAWSTIAILFGAFIWARIEWKRASNAEQRAIEQKKIAEDQKKIAQAETLRARKQNFVDNDLINVMAGRLIDLSHSQEASFWHQIKAGALSQIGNHREAIKEYDLVLQLDPKNLRAKFARGYEHYTQREAEEALQDTESYLQQVSGKWIAHQNRGIFLSLLGRYDEAEKELREAIRQFRVEGGEFGETEVAPDIQTATGRTTLLADEKVVETANYYELANLKAYAGSDEFDALLTAAHKQPNSAEAALIALDWAWLQMEKRKEDYGALVAQGALWERAGFKEWAKVYYQRFEDTHKEIKDKRYEGLTRWVTRQLATLKSVGPPTREEASVGRLLLQSRELTEQNRLDEALEAINNAITEAGDDAMLRVYHASILFKKEDYRACKADCVQILSKTPDNWVAHFWRAVVNIKLNEEPEQVVKDLQDALTFNPGHGPSMMYLADALYDHAEKEGFEDSHRELDQALQLLERSTSAEDVQYDDLPYIYYRIARVYYALGDFKQAIKPLETAIAMKDNDFYFYELWRNAQKGLGKNDGQVSCSLAGIHRQIAETKFRLGNSGKALDGCWQGLEELIADEKQLNQVEVKQEIAATTSKISQIIERAGSRAKAKEFWQSIADLESMKLLRGSAKAELERLARAQ